MKSLCVHIVKLVTICSSMGYNLTITIGICVIYLCIKHYASRRRVCESKNTQQDIVKFVSGKILASVETKLDRKSLIDLLSGITILEEFQSNYGLTKSNTLLGMDIVELIDELKFKAKHVRHELV
jgi:hypothetical protein